MNNNGSYCIEHEIKYSTKCKCYKGIMSSCRALMGKLQRLSQVIEMLLICAAMQQVSVKSYALMITVTDTQGYFVKREKKCHQDFTVKSPVQTNCQ